MSLSIIVAVDQNRAIGYKNQLLWHLSSDMKNFKQITTGHTIIMGRKTFESLPNGALPNRVNIVLSRSIPTNNANCVWLNDVESLLNYCNPEEEFFVIGGGEIYSLLLPFVSKIYLTVVKTQCSQADTWFPVLSENVWIEKKKTNYIKSDRDDFDYTFIELIRK